MRKKTANGRSLEDSMPEHLGSFTIVLHSHLPYVIGHGRWPHGMDWLNEAAAESYIPLLQAFNRLAGEGGPTGVTLGVTPILAEMLASDVFKLEFKDYLDNKIQAAREDLATFQRLGEKHFASVARMWEGHYRELKRVFTEDFGEDLLGVCRRLMDDGMLEVITSAATHRYLPLLGRGTAGAGPGQERAGRSQPPSARRLPGVIWAGTPRFSGSGNAPTGPATRGCPPCRG